jgi:hypothetical protein
VILSVIRLGQNNLDSIFQYVVCCSIENTEYISHAQNSIEYYLIRIQSNKREGKTGYSIRLRTVYHMKADAELEQMKLILFYQYLN